MKKRRGFTLIELLSGLTIMSFVLFACLGVLIFGLQSYDRTSADVDNLQKNAQGLRRISETLRSAIDVTITNDGKKIAYVLPKYSTSSDSLTGEKELLVPVVTDGVTRSYEIVNGTLKDNVTGKVLMKNVAALDPEPGSSQYGQAYQPFQLTTIGSRRAVSINLITSQRVATRNRFQRLKTTILIRNSK